MPNITIYEDITEETLNRIAKELAPIAEGGSVELDVASYGGELLVAVAIVDLMRAKRLHTTCNVIGFAASAAAIIALSCEVVNMSPLGSLMIHSAYTDGGEDDAGVERCNEVQLAIIRKRCPQLSEQLFKQDNWFNAQQALKLGLVDRIISNNNETFNAACMKYAALIKGGFMPNLDVEEMVEQIKENEEVKADEAPMDAPAEPSLVDVVEQLAKRVAELEDRINRMAPPAEVEAEAECDPEDKEQARITNMFKTLCRPQACAPVAVKAAAAPRVHKVDYKKYAAFIDG